MKHRRLKKKILNLMILAITFVASRVHAAERYEFFNGVRQMGMGGAGVAVANDETAMLLNPAGLGKLRDYIITVFDPEIEGSANIASVAGLQAASMLQPQPLLNKLNTAANRGKRLHLKAQIFPSIVVPNFGFGVFGKYSTDGEVDQAGTNFDLTYYNDYAAVAAFNFRLFEGIVKLGFNARATNRVEIVNPTISAASTNLTINSLASEGFGVGSDVGLILTAPVKLLPTVAAVWHDVGGTSYALKPGMLTSAITIPSHTPQTVDVALALFPIVGNRVRSTITVEYRDVLTASQETDVYRRTHAGIEFNIADAFFIRAGMNQRYWTAGLELAMFNYQLQAATYGEEVGTPTAHVEDRRYDLKFAIRF